MTRAQAKVIALALASGEVSGRPECLRAMQREGFLEWRQSALVVTEAGRERYVLHLRHAQGDRVVVGGISVDMRAPCVGCGRQLGSHLNRPGFPLPRAGCAGFSQQRRKAAAS